MSSMKEFEDAFLEISWINLQSEQNRYKDSDVKAVRLITITGFLTILFIGFGSWDNTIGLVFFTISLIFMFLTVAFSIAAMFSRHQRVLSTACLINDLEHADLDKQLSGIIATVAVVEDGLREVNYRKAKWIRAAVVSLSVGIIFMLAYPLFLFSL